MVRYGDLAALDVHGNFFLVIFKPRKLLNNFKMLIPIKAMPTQISSISCHFVL